MGPVKELFWSERVEREGREETAVEGRVPARDLEARLIVVTRPVEESQLIPGHLQ